MRQARKLCPHSEIAWSAVKPPWTVRCGCIHTAYLFSLPPPSNQEAHHPLPCPHPWATPLERGSAPFDTSLFKPPPSESGLCVLQGLARHSVLLVGCHRCQGDLESLGNASHLWVGQALPQMDQTNIYQKQYEGVQCVCSAVQDQTSLWGLELALFLLCVWDSGCGWPALLSCVLGWS